MITPVMAMGSRWSGQEVGRKKGDQAAERACRSQEKEVEVEVARVSVARKPVHR